MGMQRKRTRITAGKQSHSTLTCKSIQYKKRDKYYDAWQVQGWKEKGKWMRKQFPSESEAKAFIAVKQVELINEGAKQRTVLSKLNDEQIRNAEDAIHRLGNDYTLNDAVDYFLKNHREPDYTISLSDAVRSYLVNREENGVRPRSINSTRSVLRQFIGHMEDCYVHLVTGESIDGFLRSLRAKDGITKAKRKTWNNYRNDLNGFFVWATQTVKTDNRPFLFYNPVTKVMHFTAKQVADQKMNIIITRPEKVQHLLSVLMRWRGGVLVKPYILAYFAGIRPDGEMRRLHKEVGDPINMRTGIISISAKVSKTKEARKVTISQNLRAWLEAYKDAPIIPTNYDRLNKQMRKHFGLSHDETRHSFISYHVSLYRSVGDAALQAGNSESVVRKNYLNERSREEGHHFFSIVPDMEKGEAIYSDQISETPQTFKVI
jgi:integrase